MSIWEQASPEDKAELAKLAGLRDGINGTVAAAMQKAEKDRAAKERERDRNTTAHYAALDDAAKAQQREMDASVKESRKPSATRTCPDLMNEGDGKSYR